jgi:hypothetical protein
LSSYGDGPQKGKVLQLFYRRAAGAGRIVASRRIMPDAHLFRRMLFATRREPVRSGLPRAVVAELVDAQR